MRFLINQDITSGSLSRKLSKFTQAVHEDALERFDLKKLHVGPYYRVKLDEKARFIIQFAKYQQETVCLGLELLPNHEYHKSRFLRGARVDEEKLTEATMPSEQVLSKLRYLHPSHAHVYMLDKPISFDDNQMQVLSRPTPLLLVGSAGSGKTALMMQKLRQQHGRLAYITQSSWLAAHARNLYLGHAWDPGEQEIDFLSYIQLLESVAVPKGRTVTFTDFQRWHQQQRGKLTFADPHQCFEEFRGVLTADAAGPLTLDDYLALGVKKSLLPQEKRAEMHGLFLRYVQWLEQENLFEPNLVAYANLEKIDQRYDFVVVDEVQDLTCVQLALILKALRKPGQFVVGGDANQIVHPSFFSWSAVKSLFWQGIGIQENRDIAMLDVSYRNSEAVTAIANDVLRIKHARFGSVDRETNYLMRPLSDVTGQVVGFRHQPKILQALDAKTHQSSKTAVLVLREEHKAAAKQYFRTPLVFSVQEAKGLEYENIILYQFVSTEKQVYTEIVEGVSITAMTQQDLVYRRAKDKQDKSLELYKFFINALYVALTRSVQRIWIIEENPNHLLLQRLNVLFVDSVAAIDIEKSSLEDWQREASRLAMQGKASQADAIRKTILRFAPVPWVTLDRQQMTTLRAQALDTQRNAVKARQQLFQYACVMQEPALADELFDTTRFGAEDRYHREHQIVRQRAFQAYESQHFQPILLQTEKYGVDFRHAMNLTSLMMAAYAGNIALVEALLDRGASSDCMDAYGRTALHWALRRSWQDPKFMEEKIGALYLLLAPPAFDVMVEGRSLQIGREMGEYLIWQMILASWSLLYTHRSYRESGFTCATWVRQHLHYLPETIWKQKRKKNTYVQHVLARSAVGSSYGTSRQLWQRERQGHYRPNPALSLRVKSEGEEHVWRSSNDLLNIAWLEQPILSLAPGHGYEPEKVAKKVSGKVTRKVIGNVAPSFL